ncbi:MAG: hypothetical protein J7M30_09290 [Deltaproteobacteria bacterium]|nr:hypothetical protein [Deltaproteobacteria bacterium]
MAKNGEKKSITAEMDEVLEYLGVDRPTLQQALQKGIKRLLEPRADNRINAYLRGDPE